MAAYQGTTSLLAEEARDIIYDYPILYWVGWFVIAYFLLYFVTFYVGPALFGTRPYHPFMYRRRRSADEPDHFDDLDLLQNVSNAIDNAFFK